MMENRDILDAFERELLSRIGRPTQVRPFVCDGSPLGTRVFLVGINPASEMKADFWDFWVSGEGFDKARWFKDYKRDRAERPLKPGKTSRPAVSPSRRIIERVIEGLGSLRCLETNVYAQPSSSAATLDKAHRDASLFQWLVETVGPELLVVHGASAAAEVKRLNLGIPTKSVRHFSRQWSYDRAYALGSEIPESLNSGRSR